MFAQSRARKVLAVRDQGIELFFRREVHLGRLDASQGEKKKSFFHIFSHHFGAHGPRGIWNRDMFGYGQCAKWPPWWARLQRHSPQRRRSIWACNSGDIQDSWCLEATHCTWHLFALEGEGVTFFDYGFVWVPGCVMKMNGPVAQLRWAVQEGPWNKVPQTGKHHQTSSNISTPC